MKSKIKIGTRGSILALKQTEIVISTLQSIAPQIEFEIVKIKTTGDILYDSNLVLIGGKGLFLKEIEEQLIDHKIDIAIHSMKDVPAIIPSSLTIAAVLPREDVRDVLLSDKYNSIFDLPLNAKVGSSSSRRKEAILAMRPDLEVIPFRGNIDTRIRKLQNQEVDATILAMAGLNRLNLQQHIKYIFSVSEILPAIAQGAIGIECRKDDSAVIDLLKRVNHQPTMQCIQIERDFLLHFSGNCTTPIAAYARFCNDGQQIAFNAQYYGYTPHHLYSYVVKADLDDIETLGIQAAEYIKGIITPLSI